MHTSLSLFDFLEISLSNENMFFVCCSWCAPWFVFVFALRKFRQICTFILRSHHAQGWWNTSCKSLLLLRGPQTKKYMLDADAMAKGPSDVSILLIDEHIIASLKTIYGSTLPRWRDPVSGRLPSKLLCSKGLRLETTTQWCISNVNPSEKYTRQLGPNETNTANGRICRLGFTPCRHIPRPTRRLCQKHFNLIFFVWAETCSRSSHLHARVGPFA